MTTADTDALTERIAQTLSPDAWEEHDEYEGHIYALAQQASRRAAADVLPIIAVEVRKAKAEALRETADWWAANPDADVFETDRDTRNWLRDVATEYEAGDSDEHR